MSPQQPVIDKKFRAAVEETEKQLLLHSLRRFDFTNLPDAQRRRLAVEPVEPAQEEEEVVVAEEEEDELVDPFSFWSSSDARKLFGARETDQDASVTLRQKIEIITKRMVTN